MFNVCSHVIVMKDQMSRSTPRRRFLNRYRFVCIDIV